MKTIKILTCFITLVNLEGICSFNKFVPSNKEHVYSWTAEVKAGTHLPVPYASQFALKGKIHLQAKNDSVLVRITDLTHRLYNGIIDNLKENEADDLPVPEEVADLGNVFRIAYNEKGLTEAIATSQGEKEFSRNIKKAIATILQLNLLVIDEEYHHPETFISRENTIYGHGEDVYTVFPREHQIEVHKLHKMADPLDFSSYSVQSFEPSYCDVKPEKVLMHESHKKYVIESSVVKHIESIGSITYLPFKAQSERHTISVNQTFELTDVLPIKEHLHVESEHLEHSLSYHPFEEDHEGLTIDPTNGRGVVDYEQLVPRVREMLKDIPRYLREDHFSTEAPDSKRGQLIHRVQRILARFSIQKLQELDEALEEESVKVFHRVLPLVGSEASTLFIKLLVCEKKVDDETAVDLLQGVATIIKPSLSLLGKLEDLAHLDESFSWDVRKIAVLTFGSIVHKSYLKQLSTDQKPYEKYVDEYMDKIKSSTSYEIQVVYLLGLRNMKLPVLVDRLVPFLNGEWCRNRHLKLMALWAIQPSLTFNPNPDKIIEVFWPIVTNRREPTEIRAVTYYFMMYSRPSLAMLWNIFTFMLTEPDEEVYRFHYELSYSLLQSKEPCHQGMRAKVAQLLKLSPAPVRGSSSASFAGYHSEKYGFSGGVESYFIKTNASRIYSMFYTTQQFNIHDEEFFLVVIVHDDKDWNPGVWATLKSVIDGECDCHVEAHVARHDQVVNSFVVDKSNVHELVRLVQIFLKDANSSLSKDLLEMGYKRYYSSLIPTDLGIPALWEYITPEISYNNLSMVREREDGKSKIHLRYKYGSWVHTRHGLTFYNPFSDAWQGINRFHSFDILIPFAVDVSLIDDQIQFSWKKHQDPQMNVIGMRSHVKQMVFARGGDDKKFLDKFLPEDGKKFQVVGRGRQDRRDYPWIYRKLPDTGQRVFFGAYDSDQHLSYGEFQRSLSTYADLSSVYFTESHDYYRAVVRSILGGIYQLSRPGHYGLLLRITPDEVTPLTDGVLTWKPIHGNDGPGVSSKREFLLTYIARNQHETVRNWELSGRLKWQRLYGDFVEWGFKIASLVPETPYRLRVDGSKRWRKEDVDGSLSISMGSCVPGECADDKISVKMRGRKSQEQIQGENKDAICASVDHFYDSVGCLFSDSTIRRYTYEIEMKELSKDVRQTLEAYWDSLKYLFRSHYSHRWLSNHNIEENCFKVDVVYPLEVQEVDINVAAAEEVFEFSGICTKDWKLFGLTPDSTVYPFIFWRRYQSGKIHHCVIHRDHYSIDERYVAEGWSPSPKVYLKDRTFAISLRQDRDKMALTIVYQNKTLEVIPGEDDYHITFEHPEHFRDWVHHRVFTENGQKTVIVFLRRLDLEILLKFNGEFLDVLIPNLKPSLEGLCLEPLRNNTT